MLSDGKNFKLATLVSQIGTSDAFKKDMREQVEEWHAGDVLSEFALPFRVIYSLLGGNVTVCEGKKGVGVENRMQSELISRRFRLDWKQAFGLRLWYGIDAEDGIDAAVDRFVEDIEQGKVPAPRPWYIEQGVPLSWTDPGRDEREDLLWGLLKVSAGRASLEDILQPENSQPAPLNFRLCWQLSQALSTTSKIKLSPASRDALTVSYATEVVYHDKEGDWIAAIWILLHLTHAASRQRAVQDILGHHAGALFTKEAREHGFYERLVKDLKIPTALIWQAAALHWRNKQDQPFLEAQCLLRASAFADAHRIFAKQLAPQGRRRGRPRRHPSHARQVPTAPTPHPGLGSRRRGLQQLPGALLAPRGRTVAPAGACRGAYVEPPSHVRKGSGGQHGRGGSDHGDGRRRG